jgi:1-acyl-sn-glycerol-3-phosphate acyltransferase
MKKIFILLAFFFFFWIALPSIMIVAANILDRLIFPNTILKQSWMIPGFILFIPGLILMILSVIQFRYFSGEFPVSYYPPDKIIQKGLFSLWRHPIYLFATIVVAGLSLIRLSLAFILIVFPVFLAVVSIYTFNEEKGLLKRFGEDYVKYKNRVSLIVPKLHQWLKIPAFFIFKILFRIKVKGKSNLNINPPFFVVAAHRNYLDPFFVSYSIPWPVKYITTYEMFRSSRNKKIFSMLGSIPRKRFTRDMNSVKMIMKALADGHPVGVFPEGGRSWTGDVRPLKTETLEMFMKFRHIPILPVRLEGNYYSWPRWSPGMLKADLNVRIEEPLILDDSFTIEDLDNELLRRITPDAVSEEKFRCRKKQRAGKLSVVIYRCPGCMVMNSLNENKVDRIVCLKCGLQIRIDDKFDLHLELHGIEKKVRIPELYEIIRIKASDLNLSGESCGKNSGRKAIFSSKVMFFREKDDYLIPVNRGLLSLIQDGIVFSDSSGMKLQISFEDLGAVTIESYNKLQFYQPSKGELYQAIPENDSALKWQDAIVVLMEEKGYRIPVTR